MNSYAEKFKRDRYVKVDNILSEDECNEAIGVLLNLHMNKQSYSDDMCDKSLSFGSLPLNYLVPKKLEMFEDMLGLKLIPTYNYCRVYKPGEVLPKHIDRSACEISITLTLGRIGNIWPIYFLDKDSSSEVAQYYFSKTAIQQMHDMNYNKGMKRRYGLGDQSFPKYFDTSNNIKFEIENGSGVFYRGTELVHWREEYVEGVEQTQAFFHFVNANGPYRDITNYHNMTYDYR